ncbi:MAG: response regulator, partial [Candidatus Cloacimonetes bacterium]|nr:response regulator [Candidatus Cloacimonadota bacterium]
RINRILVVEDNSINAKLMQEYLSICEKTLNCSYEIDYAVTGEEAIQLTAAKHYDIILMDINLLPGMDGLTATQHIRKVAGYAETPIVAVTGYVMPEDKDKLLDGGCSHYLGKPFDKDDIIRIMQDIAGM